MSTKNTAAIVLLVVGMMAGGYYFRLEGSDALPPPSNEVRSALSTPASPPDLVSHAESPNRTKTSKGDVAPELDATTEGDRSVTPDFMVTASEYPAEYTGPRDRNILNLYNVFKGSMDSQAKQAMNLDGGLPLLKQRIYAQHAAYIELIQSHRFHYFSYEKRDGLLPLNTSQVVYHSTGSGGLQVVFQLTRDEFPEFFRIKEELEKANASLGR
jgi:hypothetical protein